MKLKEVIPIEGSFAAPMAKLKRLKKVLDYPADVLMDSPVWNLIMEALAEKLTFRDISLLEQEVKKLIKK